MLLKTILFSSLSYKGKIQKYIFLQLVYIAREESNYGYTDYGGSLDPRIRALDMIFRVSMYWFSNNEVHHYEKLQSANLFITLVFFICNIESFNEWGTEKVVNG